MLVCDIVLGEEVTFELKNGERVIIKVKRGNRRGKYNLLIGADRDEFRRLPRQENRTTTTATKGINNNNEDQRRGSEETTQINQSGTQRNKGEEYEEGCIKGKRPTLDGENRREDRED